MKKTTILTAAPLLLALVIALTGCPPETEEESPPATPVIADNSDMADAEYNLGEIIANIKSLKITATVSDGGTLTYQWYKNDKNEADTAESKKMEGATERGYSPETLAGGTNYYYVAVTNTKDGKTAVTVSKTVKIKVRGPMPYNFRMTFNGTLENTLKGEDQPDILMVGMTTPKYVDGRKAGTQAISLAGTGNSGYLQLDTAEEVIDYNRSFTVAFWINTQPPAETYFSYVSNKDFGSGGNPGFIFFSHVGWSNVYEEVDFRLNSANINKDRLKSAAQDNDIPIIYKEPGPAKASGWQHIAAVWDKDAAGKQWNDPAKDVQGQVRIYLNGAKVKDFYTDLSAGMNGNARTYIGQGIDGAPTLINKSTASGGYADGSFWMQDFLLQTGAMTDAEVAAEFAK